MSNRHFPHTTARNSLSDLAVSCVVTTFSVASALRTGTHKVKVDTAAGAIAVWLDGTKLGNVSVTLPSSAFVGFSGGTGGSTDRHAVSGFTVAAG